MDYSVQTVLLAFGFTLIAGLSTGIGAALAFFTRKTNTKFLSLALGFSAGVMIYVSFIEIFQKARTSLSEVAGAYWGTIYAVIGFFGGIAIIAIIDKLIPDVENPHEMHKIEEIKQSIDTSSPDLMRMGLFAALAIGIHNFPEGFATFMSALKDPKLGVAITTAIAIHNIPEGIAVSVPIYYATANRSKAFWLSTLSGIAEPVGAAIGFLILRQFMTDYVFGFSFAAVAGIMVFISLDELLPAAQRYGEHHLSIYGLISGMAIMALSLIMFL
ncbi:MAG: zinc transporter ZupT [Sedimentisphaeraceae bacterium JB056]